MREQLFRIWYQTYAIKVASQANSGPKTTWETEKSGCGLVVDTSIYDGYLLYGEPETYRNYSATLNLARMLECELMDKPETELAQIDDYVYTLI